MLMIWTKYYSQLWRWGQRSSQPPKVHSAILLKWTVQSYVLEGWANIFFVGLSGSTLSLLHPALCPEDQPLWTTSTGLPDIQFAWNTRHGQETEGRRHTQSVSFSLLPSSPGISNGCVSLPKATALVTWLPTTTTLSPSVFGRCFFPWPLQATAALCPMEDGLEGKTTRIRELTYKVLADRK